MTAEVSRPKNRDDFEIAIICALKLEADAVEALFDKFWDEDGDPYGKAPGDANAYTTGVLGRHNVVLAHMPGMGKGNAASVAASFKLSFRQIKLALIVGICGGVPSGTDGREIFLGDIIISTGVIQYDYGRQLPDRFIMKDTLENTLGRPNTEIRSTLTKLQGLRSRKRLEANTICYLKELYTVAGFQNTQYLGVNEDRLYKSTYRHKHYNQENCTTCAGCEKKEDKVCEIALESSCSELKCSDDMLVQRKWLHKSSDKGKAAEELNLSIHFGLIASGDKVMKSGEDRDAIAARQKVIAFEMEGAGVWDSFPCVVIKGVCDYADSHKDKRWQIYAAATAAACMKAFLEEWIPTSRVSFDTVVIAPLKVHWLVPFNRNKDFVGREDQLEEVIRKLGMDDHEDQCQRIAIAGLGGIGKTQIALEAAFRIRTKFPDYSVFWVPAVDTATFEGAYREIGHKLEIPGLDDDKADFKSLVKAYLSQESVGRWLMIIDNADHLEMLFSRTNESDESSGSPALIDYLPSNGKGSILLTTRNYKVAARFAGKNITKLEEMNDNDSATLFETSLVKRSLIDEMESIQVLLELLCNLPLAIKQAAAFLNENSISVSDYVRIYQSNNESLIKLLSESFEDHGRYQSIKNPITSTWLISFKQIQQSDQLAAAYLYFISCTSHQDIPHSLLPPASELEKFKAIGILKGYAFITQRIRQQSYDMHRLVHLVLRNWLKTRKEWIIWGRKTFLRMADIFPFYKHENRDKCTTLLPHTKYILSIQEFSKDSEEALGDLLHNIGEYYFQTGKFQVAETIYRQALELREGVLSAEHPSTLDSMNNLGLVLDSQGKYKEAEIMHRQALELKEKVLGAKHPSTLNSMNNLANVLRSQGKYKESEIIYQQALELREKVLGAEHPSTLSSMNNLANVIGCQGKYKEAEIIHRQALELKEKVLSAEHPSTLNSMNNLANVLRSQGKYKEAEIIHQQALELTEKVLGAEHPSTLSSMNNLALVLNDQGKYKEAEIIHRQALELTEKVLGAEHPSTLNSMNNLANVLRSQGKYKEAEITHRQALELTEKVLGAEHPSTLSSMNNLANVLDSQEKYKEAEIIHRQALELREKVLGAEHPSTLDNMNNLANVLDNQGKYKEAEITHRQALKLKEKVLGAEHPSTLHSMNNLGLVLDSQGKYKEAEIIHRQALKLKEKVLGAEHPSTLDSMSNLSLVLNSHEKYKEAEIIHRQALKLKEKVLGAEHPSTLDSMNNLAMVLRSQGKYKEAEIIHRQALKLKEKVLGAEHPSTLHSMNNLAIVLDSQGKYKEAEIIHRQALKLMEKVLGAEHPSTLGSMNNLALVLDNQGKYEEAETVRRRKLELDQIRLDTGSEVEESLSIQEENGTVYSGSSELRTQPTNLPPTPKPKPAYLSLSRPRPPPKKHPKPSHLKGSRSSTLPE